MAVSGADVSGCAVSVLLLLSVDAGLSATAELALEPKPKLEKEDSQSGKEKRLELAEFAEGVGVELLDSAEVSGLAPGEESSGEVGTGVEFEVSALPLGS